MFNWRVCVCDCKMWYIDIQYWFSFWQCHVVIANIFSVIEIICWVKSAWSGYSQRTHKHIFIDREYAQTADKDIFIWRVCSKHFLYQSLQFSLLLLSFFVSILLNTQFIHHLHDFNAFIISFERLYFRDKMKMWTK